ncbi:MAG: AI-2E family transporter [Flavobacteriales bacterium]|nr:AI-2E family transporter [Flavobacteriales bacterium]
MHRFFDRDRLPRPLLTRFALLLLTGVLVYHILITFRLFLTPLVLAVLFAFLLHPIAAQLERWRVPRIAANLLAIFLGIGVVYAVLLFLRGRLGILLDDLPALRQQAALNAHQLYDTLRVRWGLPLPEQERFTLSELIGETLLQGGDTLKNTFRGTANTVFAIGILPVYIFMVLYYRDKFRRFILMLVPVQDHRMAQRITRRIGAVTGRYMTGIFTVVLLLCVINSAGLLIIGLEHAVLLGIIAAICNFIPYFGTIIGFAFPFLFALVATPTPDKALWVVVLFIIVQFLENNILTPNIVGGMVRINPFFVILGVLAGGMVWGIPGMFVSIPLLAMVKVSCDVIPSLRPWAFLLGDRGTEEHALTASKIKRLFAFSRLAKGEVVLPDEPDDPAVREEESDGA